MRLGPFTEAGRKLPKLRPNAIRGGHWTIRRCVYVCKAYRHEGNMIANFASWVVKSSSCAHEAGVAPKWSRVIASSDCSICSMPGWMWCQAKSALLTHREVTKKSSGAPMHSLHPCKRAHIECSTLMGNRIIWIVSFLAWKLFYSEQKNHFNFPLALFMKNIT